MAIQSNNMIDNGVNYTLKDWFKAEWLWAILPLLMLIAGYFPIIAANINNLDHFEAQIINGHWFQRLITKIFGQSANEIIAFIPSALGAFAIWKLIKFLGGANWSAAIISSYFIAAPILGLAPNFFNAPQDGIFAGLMGLCCYYSLKAIKNENQIALAIAFLISVIACWFRPFAVWPMIAVFVAILLNTKYFEDRPKWGLISALCWGPALFYANEFAKITHNPHFSWISPNLGKVFQFKNQDLVLSEAFEFGFYFYNSIPLLILFAIGTFSLFFIYKNKIINRALLNAFVIFILFASVGAFGYGDVIAARFLIDLFLLVLFGILLSFYKIYQNTLKENK